MRFAHRPAATRRRGSSRLAEAALTLRTTVWVGRALWRLRCGRAPWARHAH